MYEGQIERREVERNEEPSTVKKDWESVFIWLIGIIVAISPMFIDAIVYIGKSGVVDYVYIQQLCLNGDIIWLMANIMVLTIIDYYIKAKNERISFVMIIGLVLWGVLYGLWIVFKYIYSISYEGNVPVVLSVICTIMVLMCSSYLRMKIIEEDK